MAPSDVAYGPEDTKSTSLFPRAATNDLNAREKCVLYDRTLFLVYCFMLYTDNFNQQKTMKDTQSVYGC